MLFQSNFKARNVIRSPRLILFFTWAENIQYENITEFLDKSNSSEVYQESLMLDLRVFSYFLSLVFFPFCHLRRKWRKMYFFQVFFSPLEIIFAICEKGISFGALAFPTGKRGIFDQELTTRTTARIAELEQIRTSAQSSLSCFWLIVPLTKSWAS